MEIFMQSAILISGVVGQLCMAKRSHKGFYWYLVSNALLIWVSFNQGLWGMCALYVFFSIMCLVSIRNWRLMDEEAVNARLQASYIQPSGHRPETLIGEKHDSSSLSRIPATQL